MPPIRFLVTHILRPEASAGYEQATLDLLRASGREQGVVRMELFVAAADPGHYHLLEDFLDGDKERAYRQSAPYQAWRAAVVEAGMLSAPEVRQRLRPLQALPAADPACSPDSDVSLRPVTEDNLPAILELKVHDHQLGFVAPNDRSLVQAYTAGERAWVRAIYADQVPVGFAMLSIDRQKPRYYLWRYMVDGRYQGLGYGRRGLQLVVDFVRSLPQATALFLSYAPGEGSPRSFYEKAGFRETGVQHGRELEMRLDL
jgi:diamine N-acetyltransferase